MAEELLIHIVGDASKLKSELDKAGKNVSSFAEKAATAGKGMAIAGGLITAAFGYAIKTSINFNKEMANVATLIPGSTKRVNELKSAMRSMAVEVGKDTTDLAQGAYQVISAFGDTADTVAILGISAKAATAGVATTTDAINLLSAVTKGYGDTSKEAVQKVSDLAFQTVTLGQTTFPELASSIGGVTPLASSLGVNMEELFAVMATGTGVTGGAAEVSTQLRGILQSLMSPTKDMTGLIGDLGYESGKAMLQELGLGGSLDAIAKAAEDSGMPLQKYIGSIEGQTLALALTGAQADTYIEKLAAMRDSTGLTDIAFKEQTEGVNAAGFAFQQAKIQITTLVQEIGDMLLPMLTPLINKVTEILGKVKDWIKANKLLVEWIVKIGAVLGALAAVGGPILMAVSALIKLKAATVALGTVATGPIGFFIVAIAGIVVGLKKWQEHSEKVREENTKLKASLLTEEEIVNRIKAINKKIADLRFQLELTGESMFLAGDLIKGQIKALEAELKILTETLNITGKGVKQVDEFAQSFADKMLKLEVGVKKVVEVTKDEVAGIGKLLEGSEKLSGQMAILTAEYELSNKTKEDTNKYYQEMLKLSEKLVKELELEVEKTKKGTKERKEAVLAWLAAQKVVKDFKEAIIELNKIIDEELSGLGLINAQLKELENRYEVVDKDTYYYSEKIRLLNEQEKYLAENLKEATEKFGENSDEVHEATMAYIDYENEVVDLGLKLRATGDATDDMSGYIDRLLSSYKDIQDRIDELTHTELENNIRKLEELRDMWLEAGVVAELVAEWFEKAVAALKLPEIDPWEDFFDSLKDEVGSITDIFMKAIKIIWDGFSDAISGAVTSLFTMAETNAQILEDMAEAEADYLEEMAGLQEDYQQIVSDGIKEIAKEKEDYYDDIAKAEADCLKKVAKLQKDYNKIVSDGIKKLTREKEDYYDDLAALEKSYNRKVSDGIKDMTRENEDYDIDMRRLKEERDEAAMEGDDERAKYYQEKMDDCTLAHKRAVEDMEGKQKELAEDHSTKLAKMEKDHKETMDEMIKKKDEEAQNALDKIEEVKDDHKEAMAKMEEDHKEAMEALIEKKDEEAANAAAKIKEIKEKYEELMAKMESEMVTVSSISETFWGAIKTAGINALSLLITKLIQYVALWLISLGPAGWAILLGIGAIGLVWLQNKAIGGEIEAITGAIKKFQMGGLGTDTVPTMLTPGEYVVARPMVDFIKKFRAIPESLTGAIARGAPTPVPAFAGGGLVGNPNITSAGYGDTNINVYITGNKISDDVDIRKLAITVSDEILRKINLLKKH